MKTRASWVLWVGLLAWAGCFDPLYEQPEAPKVYVVCCNPNRQVDTCECVAGAPCTPSLIACEGGRCVPKEVRSCSGGPQDGGTGGAGGSGGGTGGTGGSGGGSGGGAGGGGGGGSTPVLTGYQPCCDAQTGLVDTCACYDQACTAPAFTPCGAGTCVIGTNVSCG